jgi:ATP/maltotriose-dependent transcriptional regulator MalT
MAASILVTKLFIPPTRAEFVHRPGLIERLNNGLDRKLILRSGWIWENDIGKLLGGKFTE